MDGAVVKAKSIQREQELVEIEGQKNWGSKKLGWLLCLGDLRARTRFESSPKSVRIIFRFYVDVFGLSPYEYVGWNHFQDGLKFGWGDIEDIQILPPTFRAVIQYY